MNLDNPANAPDFARNYGWHPHPVGRWQYVKEHLKVEITDNVYTLDGVLNIEASANGHDPDAHSFSLLVVKAVEPLSPLPLFIGRDIPADLVQYLESAARYYATKTDLSIRLRTIILDAVAYGNTYGMATQKGIEFFKHDEVEWCGRSWEEAAAVRVRRYLTKDKLGEFVERLDYDETTHTATLYEVWDNEQRIYYYTTESGVPITRKMKGIGVEYEAKYVEYWPSLARAPIERLSFGSNVEAYYDYGLIYPWLPASDEVGLLKQLANMKAIQQVMAPVLAAKQIVEAVTKGPLLESAGSFFTPIAGNMFDEISKKMAQTPVTPLPSDFYTYLQDRVQAMRATSHMSDLDMAQPLGGRKTATEIAAIQTATGTWMMQQQNMVIEFLGNLWRRWGETQVSAEGLSPEEMQLQTVITGLDMQSEAAKGMKAQQLIEVTYNSPIGTYLDQEKVARRVSELLGISDLFKKPDDKMQEILSAVDALPQEQQQEILGIFAQAIQQMQGGAPQGQPVPAGMPPEAMMQPQPPNSGSMPATSAA